ncbi:MAG: nitronate monooxygenase [Proteobacteria bacterium]|nr:nitronate monooxygenase [Pseudomonadota bacterium]
MTESLFLKHTQTELPVICGPMYPCSNPELVAAVSEAGGIGIIQPLSLVFVHKREFRSGLEYIRSLTRKPVGLNIITEKSSKLYLERMEKYLDIALELGIRFFITSLGNPNWVVKKVHAAGGFVYHDVVDKKWALKALDNGVDGIICVNNRAGGHAGQQSAESLFAELNTLGVPLIAAGGLSTAEDLNHVMSIGYQGVQLGTRFIATSECNAHADYKDAIIKAEESDIALTEKISGVPVSVIYTDSVRRMGLKANPLAKYLLRHPRFKHWMRLYYTTQSLWKLKEASTKGFNYKDFWQAGKSVHGIESVVSVAEVMQELRTGLKNLKQS